MFSLTSRSIRLESQRRGKVPRIPVNTKSWFNSIRKKNFEDTVFPITSASITVFNEGLFRLVYLPRGERRVQIFLALAVKFTRTTSAATVAFNKQRFSGSGSLRRARRSNRTGPL